MGTDTAPGESFLPSIASHAGKPKELAMPRFRKFEPRGVIPARLKAFDDYFSIEEAL